MSAQHEGDRINNYVLEARVGAGSFGVVWRARHHIFDDLVAIKIPTDPQYVRNLQREGVAVHGLQHHNIVRAIDLDPYADPPYLIMEYVNGPSVREVIDEHRSSLPIAAAVTIMRGVLSALTVAHDAGLIHRDVKPANILLHLPPSDLATVSEKSVKVTDFGLGYVGGVTTQSIMQSGSMAADEGRSIAGTLAYMSPEQKAGRPVDGRSDLYACGVLLCEMLTGERPQGGDTPGSLRRDVPPYLDDVFRRCYTRLDRRFASTREMLAALSPDEMTSIPEPPPPMAVPSSTKCLGCGRSVHGDDQFCIYCGRQVVDRVSRCAQCEATVHANDRFCILCGNDLRRLSG